MAPSSPCRRIEIWPRGKAVCATGRMSPGCRDMGVLLQTSPNPTTALETYAHHRAPMSEGIRSRKFATGIYVGKSRVHLMRSRRRSRTISVPLKPVWRCWRPSAGARTTTVQHVTERLQQGSRTSPWPPASDPSKAIGRRPRHGPSRRWAGGQPGHGSCYPCHAQIAEARATANVIQ
jgi:hypothetical protein